MITAKIKGILTDIFPPENFSNFAKRVFWLKEPDRERFPQHWEVELHNDDMKRLDQFKVGDHLEVEIELRGKKYTKRGTYSESIILSLKAIGIQLLARPGEEEFAPRPVRMTGKVRGSDETQGKLL